jgi:hypothetical protein
MTSPFPLPLAFTSWAFNKTPDGPVDADAVRNMVAAAVRMGAVTVAVQTTEGITPDEVHELQANGLEVVGWAVCDSETAYDVQKLGVTGFMPQIEGAGQYDAAVQTLRTLKGLLPVSVISDYGGLESKERCDVLRSYGATSLFVEAYADSGATHADLPHYVVELSAPYGYTAETAIPCMGTYRNEYPTAYAGVDAYAGPSFSVYLLEPMNTGQLDAWGELAHRTPPPNPNPPKPSNGGTVTAAPAAPKDTDCRHAAVTACLAWESNQADAQPLSRMAEARRILQDANTNDLWTKPTTIAIPAATPGREAIKMILDNIGLPA